MSRPHASQLSSEDGRRFKGNFIRDCVSCSRRLEVHHGVCSGFVYHDLDYMYNCRRANELVIVDSRTNAFWNSLDCIRVA